MFSKITMAAVLAAASLVVSAGPAAATACSDEPFPEDINVNGDVIGIDTGINVPPRTNTSVIICVGPSMWVGVQVNAESPTNPGIFVTSHVTRDGGHISFTPGSPLVSTDPGSPTACVSTQCIDGMTLDAGILTFDRAGGSTISVPICVSTASGC